MMRGFILSLLFAGISAQTCGVPSISPNTNLRIVGGSESRSNSWPYTVSIGSSSSHFCGGTILNNQWILTAAHCFDDVFSLSGMVVRLGYHNLYGRSGGEQTISMGKVLIHRSYSSSRILNDIALIKLSRPVTFSRTIQPVCLPPAGVTWSSNSRFIAVGWGQTRENGPSASRLRQVTLPHVPMSTCQRWDYYGSQVKSPGMICAGYAQGGKDACQGDSGGPLYGKYNNKWTLIGVSSWGDGCARPKRPGVFTNVANYISWINTSISRN